MDTTNEKIIDLRQVFKAYETEAGSVMVLKDINLEVDPGEFVSIVGPSGSGKSTLLNMITGIDAPTDGEVHVAGHPIHGLNENDLARWRGRQVGVVFQFFQLLPTLTVLENVILPMDFCNVYARGEREERAMHWLERVGIPEQAHKLPSQLSGGQQQRAAIARALANDPPLVVADEPTGNLEFEDGARGLRSVRRPRQRRQDHGGCNARQGAQRARGARPALVRWPDLEG